MFKVLEEDFLFDYSKNRAKKLLACEFFFYEKVFVNEQGGKLKA